MQLKNSKVINIKSKLGLATCSLLQVAAPAAQAAGSDWDIDTAFLFYSESDSRVQAAEPAVYLGRNLGDEGDRIDLRLVVDALTGATPNGAHAISAANGAPQTFSTPSGNGTYTAEAGETPLDDTFHDTRVAVGADWTIALDRLSKVILGVNASGEFDYFSLGLSTTYLRDFNNRNTTLKLSAAINNDTISPEGNIPLEFAPMVISGNALNRDGADDTKTITDFLIGVTQVVNRNTIIELNYSLGLTDGYQNDPYKIVTVVNADGSLADTGIFDASTGNLPYIYEKRPDSRTRNTLFFRTAHHLTEDVINFSYRYFWDDWGINSHTFDFRYRYQLGSSYLQPHIRYYTQDAADFYTHNLVVGSDIDSSGTVLVKEASNDYRLGELVTTTIGLKYGIPISSDSEFSVRGEFINQSLTEDGVPSDEQTPDLDAVVLQVNYSLVW